MHVSLPTPCPRCLAPSGVGCWYPDTYQRLRISPKRVHPARYIAHRANEYARTAPERELARERERVRLAILRSQLRKELSIPLN